jgi:hypothetical protein
MKIIIVACFAFFLCVISHADPSEIKGSVFFVFNGAVITKVPLAKVFVLNQKDASAMFATNSAAVKAKIAQVAKEQTDSINQKVADYNALIRLSEITIMELRVKIEELDKEIELKSKLLEQSEANTTSREKEKNSDESIRIWSSLTKSISDIKILRNATVREMNRAIDTRSNMSSNTPKTTAKLEYSKIQAQLQMCELPSTLKPITKADAEGNFSIKLPKDAVYIVITPMDSSPSTAFLRWFLKINLLEQTNEKFLFTNENYFLQDNPANAISMILNEDVFKCELN